MARLPPLWISRQVGARGNIGQSNEVRKLLGEPIEFLLLHLPAPPTKDTSNLHFQIDPRIPALDDPTDSDKDQILLGGDRPASVTRQLLVTQFLKNCANELFGESGGGGVCLTATRGA